MQTANLVGITQPTALTGCTTAEELVAYCARVSNPKNQGNHTTGMNLIKSLLRDGHWSPLEMVNLTIEIVTTRDIARQILRHRSFSFQEFSQRYAKAFAFVQRAARLQDHKNRQNSIETDNEQLLTEWLNKQQEVLQIVERNYEWALSQGIAKEQARAILPEGMTESRLYMQGSLRSWIHYCMLRRSNGTQKEHIEVANLCWDIISEHFPSVAQACENL
jgi:thymidylate synthase (FAD)